MKAEELMVGDIVQIKVFSINENLERKESLLPVKIAQVSSPFIVEYLAGQDFEDRYRIVESYDNIYPIPITPEILEKNGFMYDGMAHWEYRGDEHLFISVCPVQSDNDEWWDPDDTGFEVTNKYSDVLIEGLGQVYVHQLQNALRLCGINKEITL